MAHKEHVQIANTVIFSRFISVQKAAFLHDLSKAVFLGPPLTASHRPCDPPHGSTHADRAERPCGLDGVVAALLGILAVVRGLAGEALGVGAMLP